MDEGIEVFANCMDVTSRTEVEGALQRTVERYGRLDILVNNAGVTRDNLVYKMTDEEWRAVLNVHLTGVFLCSRAAQRHVVERGACSPPSLTPGVDPVEDPQLRGLAFAPRA